jgi:beta-glucanase (GH16 family)
MIPTWCRVGTRSAIAALLLTFCVCGWGRAPAAASASPSLRHAAAAADARARLLFDDEFDGTLLDWSKWFWCYPYASDDYCTNGQKGIRYREEEQYRPTQLLVGGGALQLVALRHSVRRNFPWISGMVTTGGPFRNPPHPTFAFLYGYAEMRAKLPAGDGFWPAFWLLPADGSWPPEIDVMEWQGGQPRKVHTTVHFSDRHSRNDSLTATFEVRHLTSEYHVYAVDWEPHALTWYVDGVPRFVVPSSEVEGRGGTYPRKPMYLLVSLALGGWVGPPNRHTPSPASMSVDYVRVWDRRP